MTGLVDLPIEIIREYDGIFFFGGAGGPFPDLDQVGTDGDVGAMFFQDADGEDTGFVGLGHCLWPVAGGELVPAGVQELSLGGGENGYQKPG